MTSVVLVLRALGLGDMLTGVPALRAVRRAWPAARMVLAAPVALGDLLVDLGVIDDVVDASGLSPLVWDRPAPEVAVNLHGRGPQSHRLLQSLDPRRLVGFACPAAGFSSGLDWDPAEHEVDRWCRLVRSAGGACSPGDLRLSPWGGRTTGPVVLHPGAASGSRRWPVQRWSQVAAQLAQEGRRVIITGVCSERVRCDRVAAAHPAVQNRCGLDDVRGLASLVGRAALLLCGDTGVAHLATSCGTPSVLLFGPTPPSRWGPRIDGERHLVLWHPEPGDPPGDPHAGKLDVRLDRITAAEVLAAAASLLESPAHGIRPTHHGARGGAIAGAAAVGERDDWDEP